MSTRQNRINAEMGKIISEGIRKIKDPSCTEMATVIACEVTKDLKYANVILSIFSTDENRKEKTFLAIKHAKGFIKHYVSQEMRIRQVPDLKFVLDNSAEYSAKINSIIDKFDYKTKAEKNED